MDAEEFKAFGKAAIDFIANYVENSRDLPVLPSVEPGYLQHMIPKEVPISPEKWQDIMKDMERVIMPGITHWQSPNFHAYYPTGCSYPTIIGELLSAGLGIIGFSWITSPACTELEVVMMDWLGKLIRLPEEFLNCSEGPGGGVIQGSASESTLVCLLAAKEKTLRRLKLEHPEWDEGYIKGKMIAYSSEQSNSSVEKAGILASMKMRLLETDEKCSLRGDTLVKAFKEDIANGLIPTYVCATLGTTGTCAFDDLDEIGPICREYNVWLHIDAAYAGAAFVCPEFRHHMSGLHWAESFSFNCHKWLLVNFDCSPMWVKDSRLLIDAFNVERIYLTHEKEGNPSAPDYRHWQIPLGRRFRSLKLWITLRSYGEEGLQNHIRRHVALAKLFETFVKNDERFEIVGDAILGLVCFKIKGPNGLTKRLLNRLTARKNIFVIAGKVRDTIVIRFVVCSRKTEEDDMEYAWNEIQGQAAVVLSRADDEDLAIPSENGVNGRVNGHANEKICNGSHIKMNGNCLKEKMQGNIL